MSKLISGLMLVLLLAGCKEQAATIVLHQEGHQLLAESQGDLLVYWEDVIDYTYDQEGQQLFVLHGERSSKVDRVGYQAALTDGLDVGGYLRIYNLSPTIDDLPSLVYENDFTWVNPWSLDSGDFENDGGLELFMGCYRATDFYPPDRRPFVVTWDGEIITKKWTGSYIGLDDLISGRIEDMNGDDREELVLRVMTPEGSLEEKVYSYGVFTFDLVETRPVNQVEATIN